MKQILSVILFSHTLFHKLTEPAVLKTLPESVTQINGKDNSLSCSV